HQSGYAYTFHAPLSRSACEALARAVAARLGRRFGRDLALEVADLGWSLRLTDGHPLAPHDIAFLLTPDQFAHDPLAPLDTRDLPRGRRRRPPLSARRCECPDGPPQPRRRPTQGRGPPLGQPAPLSPGEGCDTRPPPAPRNPPRSASRPARRPHRSRLARND